jgi:malonyl-CoA/methylmalonyl-CoA synthetase
MTSLAALLPTLTDPPDGDAISFPGQTLTYHELATAATTLAASLEAGARVAFWATARPETCVAMLAALLAGAPAVPLNPKLGDVELAHILADSEPEVVLAAADDTPPAGLAGIERLTVSLEAPGAPVPPEPPAEAPAIVVYTSGTTGPPKGVLLPRRAIASNLDALYDAWSWTASDVLVHGLPLFHVHGLVLGSIGPVRLGGSVVHTGQFSPDATAAALRDGGTMLFGVPTMYHRLADAVESDAAVAAAVARARLLVSGSAPLAIRDYRRIEAATGQRIVERYGLSETVMNCSARADGARTPGYVGAPLPGVELRLVDEDGADVDGQDDETMGEVAVRGPNVMLGYLNRPDATAEVVRDGWFFTGDLAVRGPAGVRIIGRKSTDLIKTGGFRVGAGEVEACLLEHPAVAEVAVTGEPDDDLGERIVAWIVPTGGPPDEQELIDHVARHLTPHKRPRTIRVLDQLPRNELGKVQKAKLPGDPARR